MGNASGGGTGRPWWCSKRPCECIRGTTLDDRGEAHGASPEAEELADPARDEGRSRRHTALVPELTEATSLASSSAESTLASTCAILDFLLAPLLEDEVRTLSSPPPALPPDLDRVIRVDPRLGYLRLRLRVWVGSSPLFVALTSDTAKSSRIPLPSADALSCNVGEV
jgi:hypothetical protein